MHCRKRNYWCIDMQTSTHSPSTYRASTSTQSRKSGGLMWSNQTDGSDSRLVEKGLDNDIASTTYCSYWYLLNITSEVCGSFKGKKGAPKSQRKSLFPTFSGSHRLTVLPAERPINNPSPLPRMLSFPLNPLAPITSRWVRSSISIFVLSYPNRSW